MNSEESEGQLPLKAEKEGEESPKTAKRWKALQRQRQVQARQSQKRQLGACHPLRWIHPTKSSSRAAIVGKLCHLEKRCCSWNRSHSIEESEVVNVTKKWAR